MAAGQFRPLVDRRYPLTQIVEAYRYVETGQKVGNVVVTERRVERNRTAARDRIHREYGSVRDHVAAVDESGAAVVHGSDVSASCSARHRDMVKRGRS